MLSYLFFSTTSILCIFQLKNILEIYNKSFAYFKTLLLLILFLFVFAKIGLFEYLYIVKVIILLSFVWLIYKRGIKLNINDQVFFFGSLFLIYFNYNTFFSGTDIFNGFGYFSKYLFYNHNIPIIDENELIANGQYSIPQILFYNFFLSGKTVFSEMLCSYANNIFLLINFVIIFETFNHKKNYFHIICLLGILYFLIQIFGGEGTTIRTDEISIFLYFSLIIFILNISKVTYSNCIIILLCLTIALLNKPASLFFLFLPFSIIFIKFYNEKYSLLKISLSFVIAFLLFSYFYKVQSNDLNYNKFKLSLYEINSNYEDSIKNDDFDIKFEKPGSQSSVILITRDKFLNLFKSIIHENNIINSKKILLDIFDTETYKASFIIGKKILNKKTDLFSFDLIKWFILFSIFLLILFFNKEKLKINFSYIFCLYLLFILNFSASFFNEINRNTTINKNYEIATRAQKYQVEELREEITDPKYDINYSKSLTDYSRYNGWSILLIFLILNYYLYNYKKEKLKYLLIFLMLITPLRGFGNLFKIYARSFQDDFEYRKRMSVFNEIKNIKANNCLNTGALFILDIDNVENTGFNRYMRTMKYHIFDKRIVIYAADSLIFNNFKYDKFKNFNFKYLNKKNNIKCLITFSETEIEKIISLRYEKIFSKEKYNFYEINNEV